MARYVETPVGGPVEFGPELLLIHARDSTDDGRPLVVLVHGLNGHATETWRAVLDSHWMREVQFDVGLVNYASGWRRYQRLRQSSPSDVAHDLALEISQLSRRRVVLVGHSMGGLIAGAAVRELHQRFRSTEPEIERVAGLITLCTPKTGSGWAGLLSFAPGPAWIDRQVLRRHSALQREVEEFFSTWIDADLEGGRSGRVHVPMFAASATRDLLVNRMGAELGVPGQQRKRIVGGHSSSLEDPATVDWLAQTVGRMLSTSRARPLRKTVRAEFNGSGAFPSWEGAYRVAMEQFQAAHGERSISDRPQGGLSPEPDLVVRAYCADSKPETGVPSGVRTDVKRQDASAGRMALGVSPIGRHHELAVDQLRAEVDWPQLRWFRGARNDDAEIVAVFREFFTLAAGVTNSRPALRPPLRTQPTGLTDGV